MRALWLFGQFLIVMAGGAVMIAVVIGIWYVFSFVVLTLAGRAFKLRGRTPRD